jgi:hypothetical protein
MSKRITKETIQKLITVPPELAGYAVKAAVEELADNWAQAIWDGCQPASLIHDVDDVIEILSEFKRNAQKFFKTEPSTRGMSGTAKLVKLTNGKPDKRLVKYFADIIANYPDAFKEILKTDPDEIKTVRQDVKDLKAIYKLYAKGDFKSIKPLARELDTVVRDTIPAVIWAQMYGTDDLTPCGMKSRAKQIREILKR